MINSTQGTQAFIPRNNYLMTEHIHIPSFHWHTLQHFFELQGATQLFSSSCIAMPFPKMAATCIPGLRSLSKIKDSVILVSKSGIVCTVYRIQLLIIALFSFLLQFKIFTLPCNKN